MEQDYPGRRIISIEILFGYFSSVVEMSTRYLRAALMSIRNEMENGERCIDIVAHSMGGFVGRAYI